MNSSNNSAVPSRRFKWLRRLLWTFVCLLSVITLLWQWENWRSARELAEVHRRVVERLGTDDPVVFMPPKVSDEQNYFANPVLESWLRVTKPESGRMKYTPPANALMPKDFIKPETLDAGEGGIERLDLDAWIKKRGVVMGESPAAVLARELGNGNGLLPKLAEGINQPFSVMKPGQQEAMEASGGNPWEAALPEFQSISEFQRQLGLHLRSAALVGDADKAASTAQIMLRFSEAPARGGIIGCLVPLALHGITFDALHEALSRPAWTEESLSRLQLRLGQFDDLENYEKAHACEILSMFRSLAYLRSHADALDGISNHSPDAPFWERTFNEAFEFAMKKGPIGWHDANIAFYSDCMLDQLGPPGPDAWLSAASRDAKVRQCSKEANAWPNPRRLLGAIAIPNLGNITHAAAETLFHRRCLIIACALEKHRLRHGTIPATLDAVKDDLKLFNIVDPARPTQWPGYRLETNGYLLWSAGPDAKDDGGVKDRDWLWRMKREP
ncbi:hypothetical protein [Prosthecobacter sp.]|uniref:hypothetical protein n=1 Tax=Prosthecobacter sp. TaxID=1965333 RepID=UPI002AB86B87|nr:hypothetical protein [Prosthecobacter sp.]MDZ4401458.1 hypothetical protein [Prosthecobacter sp.]